MDCSCSPVCSLFAVHRTGLSNTNREPLSNNTSSSDRDPYSHENILIEYRNAEVDTTCLQLVELAPTVCSRR